MRKIINKTFDCLNRIFERIFIHFFCFFPVKNNKIVFINFNGKGYGDNPKYIAETIKEKKLDYKMIWLVKNKKEIFPDYIRAIGFYGVKALYNLATAKIIITNVKNDLRMKKKKKQKIIQTWHGSFSPKYLEKAAADKLPFKYIKESIKNSNDTDIFLSNSSIQSQAYRDEFWCKCKILEIGYPRNDILFQEDRKLK